MEDKTAAAAAIGGTLAFLGRLGLRRALTSKAVKNAGKTVGKFFKDGFRSDRIAVKKTFKKGPKGFIDWEKKHWRQSGKAGKTMQGLGYAGTAADFASGNPLSGVGYAVAPMHMMTFDAVKGIRNHFKSRNASQSGKYFGG